MKLKMFSVAQHLLYIEEERSKVHDKLCTQIWTAATEISSVFSATFIDPAIGVYRDAKLVLALGPDVEYISAKGLVRFATAQEYLNNPIPLFRKGTGELILESQHVCVIHKLSPNAIFSHYTNTIEPVDIAAKLIKMYILSIVMRNNHNNLFLYKNTMKNATKSKSNYDFDFMYFFREEARYSPVKIVNKNVKTVYDNIMDAICDLAPVKNILAEVSHFLEFNEWCEFRVTTEDPIDNLKSLSIEAVSDRRILLYHEKCIEEINSIKSDIFDGKINDPVVIARYSGL